MSQHDNAPVHKVSSLETWFAKLGVEELKCPPQNPDLKCSCGSVSTNAHSHAPNSSDTPSQMSGVYYNSDGELNLKCWMLKNHIWVLLVRCPKMTAPLVYIVLDPGL